MLNGIKRNFEKNDSKEKCSLYFSEVIRTLFKIFFVSLKTKEIFTDTRCDKIYVCIRDTVKNINFENKI